MEAGERGTIRSSGLKEALEVRSILVIHQGALGDFILALPVLENLRKAFPQARLVVMGYPRILELVSGRFYAEEACSIDRSGMASFFGQRRSLDPDLSHFFSTFDLIVLFAKDPEGIFIGNLRRVCRGRILHINPFPTWMERIHLTDHLLKELSRHDLAAPERKPKLRMESLDQQWGKNYWRRKGVTPEERAEAIVIHPGSGSKKKVWPLERFIDLIRHLQERFHSRVFIIIGPAEGWEVRKAFEGLEWEMGAAAPMTIGGLSLLQLASVIEGCRLFIGNDSGISHMAAALGIPTLTIFGPTDPKVWAPRGEKAAVVRREIACSPCSQERFFQCHTIECMKGIELKDVLKGLERLGIRT
jgi:ADP-heptose:LPS heptosyltransferase